jgi:hypothetical protein
VGVNKNNTKNSSDNNNMNYQNEINEEPASCGFCGLFNTNFDENALYLHYYRECPMVKLITLNNIANFVFKM